MQVFYPLPVTPHYVRLKTKKVGEMKNCFEKNKKESEKMDIKEDSSNSSERKVSIEKHSESAEVSKSIQTSIFEALSKARSENVVKRQTVTLFDISCAKQRKLEQEKFVKLFISCSRSIRTRSSSLNTGGFYFLNDIICRFKQVDVKSASSRVLMDDELNGKFLQTITCKRKKIENHYETDFVHCGDTKVIFEDTTWLKLMSWWRVVNGSLDGLCSKLHKCLRDNTEFKAENNEMTVLTRDLQSFLTKTKLYRSTAALSAMKTYVYFDVILPDIEMWSLTRESEWREFQEYFLQNVREDSTWIRLLMECHLHSLNLLSVAIKFLSESYFNKCLQVRNAVKYTTEVFFLAVIQPLLEAKNEVQISTDILVEASNQCLEKFINQVDTYKDSPDQLGFETTVLVVSQTLVEQMKLSIKYFQTYFYTSGINISNSYLSRYLRRTISEGIILSKMSLSKDLLSLDLLRKLDTNKDLRNSRSIKFAYILITCNKVMHGKDESIFRLPNDYFQYDFEAFLNDILQQADQTRMDILLRDALLRLRVLEEELTQKLAKSFKKLDKKVNAANVLLSKAKYFQSKQNYL